MAQCENISLIDFLGQPESISFKFHTSITTQDLKHQLLQRLGENVSDVALFFNLNCLDETKTLSEYNILPESLIKYISLKDFNIPTKLKPLSEGHLSQTYLNGDMVIKQYILKNNTEIEQNKLLMSEVISYFKLEDNSNVVEIKGFYKQITEFNEIKFCIGLEYMDKGNLESHLINKTWLGEHQIFEIIRVVVSVLRDMHERKIIHRNIRCASIFLKSPNIIKLANFGFSKYQDGTSNAELLNGMLISVPPGPINWMAPEMLSNTSYGCKVDIWAVGMTMIEILLGHRPLFGLSENEVIRNICYDPIHANLDIPPKMKNIIDRCLCKNPMDRPTAEELLQLL